ncbi:MAG: DUF4912 domain-containing protein [Candidatus Aureabacteria bacterium]|nr:DUF4912 domain-containing protein [Candidatus Auribacterota bacterium]
MVKDLKTKTINELKNIAKKLKIRGYGKMTKKKLAESIKKSEENTSRLNAKETKTDLKAEKREEIKEKAPTSNIDDGQSMISESKYITGYSVPKPCFEENFVFPANYGKNNIVLMIRDPYWMYTYWNITEEKFSEIRTAYGDDAISNSKLTLRVKEITGQGPENPNEVFDLFPPIGTKNWYVNIAKPNSSYCVEIGLLLANNEFILIARSNVVHMPLFGPSDIVDEKWASLIDFEKIYALSGGFDTGKSSGELRKEMVKRLEQSLFSGASGAVTSFGKKKQSGKSEKTFFLVVNTELIVYGQTVPSAHLTIQGRDQKLNHDGTFSVRFALPEGVQEIPVTAISEDKEDTITITPVVTKETR